MRFTLTYQGRLPSVGNATIKQEIRRALHPQLKHLFTYPPLDSRASTMLYDGEGRTNRPSIIERVDGYKFAPLVTRQYRLVATIELLFLRPEPPGNLLRSGGDIDNRLKTLFDALRMPRVPDEIPSALAPKPDEDPFFCLLQDDGLITEIDVKTDVLLDPDAGPSDVHLFMRIRTEVTEGMIANLGL